MKRRNQRNDDRTKIIKITGLRKISLENRYQMLRLTFLKHFFVCDEKILALGLFQADPLMEAWIFYLLCDLCH